MSNAYGSYETTPERTMAAFDKLPPSARSALANSLESWATQPILGWHRKGKRGFVTGKDIAETIARWDSEELTKREDQRLRAIGPYKGNVRDEAEARARTPKRRR